MNIKEYPYIFENFIDLSNKSKFPIDECTQPKIDDEGIYEGENSYLVLIQYEDHYELNECIPYIWKAADFNNPEDFGCTSDEVLYGWVSKENRNLFYDNVVNGIHNDSFEDGLVIGYSKKRNFTLECPVCRKKMETNFITYAKYPKTVFYTFGTYECRRKAVCSQECLNKYEKLFICEEYQGHNIYKVGDRYMPYLGCEYYYDSVDGVKERIDNPLIIPVTPSILAGLSMI